MRHGAGSAGAAYASNISVCAWGLWRYERRRQLLSDFAEQWASINEGRFEPSTRIRYVNCLAHASEALGHIYVDGQPLDPVS